jgi:hypothetical protein
MGFSTPTVSPRRQRFQVHQVDDGAPLIPLNATLSGLKFIFDITLGRGGLMARMQPESVPRAAMCQPAGGCRAKRTRAATRTLFA